MVDIVITRKHDLHLGFHSDCNILSPVITTSLITQCCGDAAAVSVTLDKYSTLNFGPVVIF